MTTKKSVPANKKIATGPERIVYIEEVEKEDCDTIIEKLKEIKNTKAYFVYSWSKNRFDIHVTHKGATKRHALQILLDILDISSEDIIAAGDGNNDLALFEVAKYKIAMDNGQPELKAKADIIAPSVENDGLAVVLEDINLTK